MINNEWSILLKEEFNKKYYKELIERINLEYNNKVIYPKKEDIFKALEQTDYSHIKVVIIGQDPYHGEGQANGLAFSVNQGKLPPSLKNIFRELKEDLNINREEGNLESWSKQGVLLLNTVLTVEKDKPNSHQNYGWEIFTDNIISLINKKDDSVVFILWGDKARRKKRLITNLNHYIIESSHPSPFAYRKGFMGSKPFSKTNEFLKKCNKSVINW